MYLSSPNIARTWYEWVCVSVGFQMCACCICRPSVACRQHLLLGEHFWSQGCERATRPETHSSASSGLPLHLFSGGFWAGTQRILVKILVPWSYFLHSWNTLGSFRRRWHLYKIHSLQSCFFVCLFFCSLLLGNEASEERV